jgi:hypothetical protein
MHGLSVLPHNDRLPTDIVFAMSDEVKLRIIII